MTTNDHSFNHSTVVLRSRTEELEALKAAGGEVAQVLAEIRRVWGDDEPGWLLEPHMLLNNEAPVDLLLRGETQPVRELLGRLEYGSAV